LTRVLGMGCRDGGLPQIRRNFNCDKLPRCGKHCMDHRRCALWAQFRCCEVSAFFSRVVPFWQAVAALLRIVQCVTTQQSKCQKSDEAGPLVLSDPEYMSYSGHDIEDVGMEVD